VTTQEQRSADVGDEVEITARGRVVAREMRGGLDCVAVEIPGVLNPLWRSVVDDVVLVRRAD
jgi:hypothetical protein